MVYVTHTLLRKLVATRMRELCVLTLFSNGGGERGGHQLMLCAALVAAGISLASAPLRCDNSGHFCLLLLLLRNDLLLHLFFARRLL
jgi:hypothetical protein